jgi:hypothetical protein
LNGFSRIIASTRAEAIKEEHPVTDGETYLKTRLDLGLSRADVSAMAKRAGYSVSQSTIDRLEHKGPAAIGRGLSPGALGWLEYVYGISDPDGIVDWARVERGAPVVVHHEKGAFQFHAAEEGEITVFGGRRNEARFQTFPVDQVRLIALTALPPPETARVFESRYKGSDSAYARRILDHMAGTPGAHSVGGMAWTLGMHNAVVSRVAADLAKKGRLRKIQRGVFVLAEEQGAPEPLVEPEPVGEEEESTEEAATVKSALAERVMVPEHRLFQ